MCNEPYTTNLTPILYTWRLGISIPLNVVFGFDVLEDLVEDEDLGEEVDDEDDFFLRFCFLGTFERSVVGRSLNISDGGWRPTDWL